MSDRLLVTKGEAAEQLGVSVRTLERLVATGRLPQVHVERSARFRVKDLEEYVDGLRAGALDDSDSGPSRLVPDPAD
jgi:excisionase family DNA binding protein